MLNISTLRGLLAQDYKSMRSVNIHYPPSQYLDDSARGSVFADLPGLRLAKSIQLVKDSSHATAASPIVFGPQGNRLTLRLHNKVRTAVPCTALTWQQCCCAGNIRLTYLALPLQGCCAACMPLLVEMDGLGST